MDENFDLLDCDDDNVIAFGDYTYKIGRLKKELNNLSTPLRAQEISYKLDEQGLNISQAISNAGEDPASLFRGIDCEILQLGAKKWKKGKVKIKITLEIYAEPEDIEENTSTSNPEINPPESPVDPVEELRRQVINLQNK